MSGPARRRGRLGRVLSNAAVGVGCVMLLGGFVMAAVLYQPYTVPTDSMSPAVAAGDRVLAQRIDGGEVRRGDVVVFRDAEWGDSLMIKRVIGVGGDTVACCDAEGRLSVNGEPVAEPYVDDEYGASLTGFEAEVPEGELFLLGDDRSNSRDSRSLLTDTSAGTVPRDAVSGRVEATVWPLGRVGLLARATGFTDLPGGISGAGPLRPLFYVTTAGAVLILAGAAYAPLARRASRSGPPRRADVAGDAQ
ncbi:signal peptidase I [Streptomyces litchfieldiae]|uniref:Signal peptidase I n=1 Tax=Streptomyces litchfieldiae TaxID=3075543 RepID=A0ABU2MKD5_9ACTN|nr:signal peptidase I [Streptomyces sp. DSM 44938]MDT0341139.1 signal peptidase I [Streptomyces sp. DSM 44938]